MKLRRLLIGLTTGVVLAASGVAAAASSDTVQVHGTQDSSIYKTGQTVDITGTINGDVYAAGQDVTVDATVNGDVLAAGQSVTIRGTVHGDVRAAGQSVHLEAQVDRNATVAGQDVAVRSVVGRDAALLAQSTTIFGQVGRDARVRANTFRLAQGSHIGRNLDYASKQQLPAAEKTMVSGLVTYHQPSQHHGGIHWAGVGLAGHLLWLLMMLVFVLIFVAVFPRAVALWNERARSRLWATFLTGFLAMFVVPVLFVALLITIIGVPLAICLLLAWLLALFVAVPLASYFVGDLIFRANPHPVLKALLGFVVLAALSLVPVLGWLVTLVVLWYGTGALLGNIWDWIRRTRRTRTA